MAYVMSLRGSGFSRKNWLENVRSAYMDDDSLSVKTPLSPLCQQLAMDLDDELDGEELWLHPTGGIRGVTVRENEEGIDLSLPTGCSKTDFELAWDLMRIGVKHGAMASDEEQDSLTLTDEEITAITARQSDFYWASLMAHVKKGEGEVTLPVGGLLSLNITPDDAAQGVEALERNLVDRMNRYSNVFVASVMRVSKDGVGQSLSNYGHMASLINAEIELIMAQGECGDIIGNPIPTGHFYSVLGGRVEKLGSWNYIPAIDFNAEPDLVAALRDVPATASTPKPTVATQEGLTGEDWAKLAKSPCLVFLMVAAADGGIDNKEVMAFGTILSRHGVVPSPVFSRILQIAQNNFETFIREIMESGTDVKHLLAEIGMLLSSGKIPREEAVSIAQNLCGLGFAIASASGGFLGIGPKVSKKEKEVLKFLEIVLMSCAKGETAILSLLGLGGGMK